jgi:hypothetical protein
MPKFAKNPKIIVGAIVVLWVAYIVGSNFQLEPVSIHLIPFAATLDFKVSAVIIGAAIFGSAATLIIQWLWKRRSSKNGSAAAAASAASNRTVA